MATQINGVTDLRVEIRKVVPIGDQFQVTLYCPQAVDKKEIVGFVGDSLEVSKYFTTKSIE